MIEKKTESLVYIALLRKRNRGKVSLLLFTEIEKIDKEAVRERMQLLLQEKGMEQDVLMDQLTEAVSVQDLLVDVVHSLLEDAAEANRESFRQRQRKGFEQAQEKGLPVGRPCRRDEEQFTRVREQYRSGEINGQEAAD